MNRAGLAVVAVLATLALAPGAASADRLTDEQVKSLIEQVDKGFDKWKDGLEKANMDEAVIRSAAGTIDVKQFLKGFEDDINRLKDKFKPENAAVTEATQVLRKGSDVERRYQQRGGAASSEWQAFSRSLGSLAAAYGVTAWPIESLDTQLSRLNDKDLAARLEGMVRMAKQFGKEAGKVKDQAAKALAGDAKQIESAAKELGARIKGDKPASSEAKSLVRQVAALQPKVSALAGLSTPGKTAWDQVANGATAVALAFGEPLPR